MELFTVIIFTKNEKLPLKYRKVSDVTDLFNYVTFKLNRTPVYANLYDKHKKFVKRIYKKS